MLPSIFAGDYDAGTYEELAGSAYAYVIPVEELLLGACGANQPVPTI